MSATHPVGAPLSGGTKAFTGTIVAARSRSLPARGLPFGSASLRGISQLSLPLWDDAIAKAYGCYSSGNPVGKYLAFMRIARDTVADLQETVRSLLDGKTPLKVLDEYNYARFTKKWV